MEVILLILWGLLVPYYLYSINRKLTVTKATKVIAYDWKIEGHRVTLTGWKGEPVYGLLRLTSGSRLALCDEDVFVDGVVISIRADSVSRSRDKQLRFFEDLEGHLDRGLPETDGASHAYQ